MKDSFIDGSYTEAAAVDPSAAFNTTNQDAVDMARLGKAQQFQRNFSYWSTFGFVSIYMATWEYTILSMSPVLSTTGYGGFFWTFLGCIACFASIVLSLAEMSSMSPTAGGQYHWVSEFAPARWQKEASYASGWMSTLGWIASLSGSSYGCGNLVIVCINLVQPDFVMTAWQLFLIILAFALITIVLNTLGARILPAMEVASLIGHTAGFVVFIGVLWGLCRPLNSGRDVFLSFENGTGWSDYGAACLLAQVSIIWSMLGSDTIVHICRFSQSLHHIRNSFETETRAVPIPYLIDVSLISRGGPRRVDDSSKGYVVVLCQQHRHGYRGGHHSALLYWALGGP